MGVWCTRNPPLELFLSDRFILRGFFFCKLSLGDSTLVLFVHFFCFVLVSRYVLRVADDFKQGLSTFHYHTITQGLIFRLAPATPLMVLFGMDRGLIRLSLHDESNGESNCRIVGQVDVPDLDHFGVLHFDEGFNDACFEGGYFD